MRSKSFSRFLRLRSEVRVTISLMPVKKVSDCIHISRIEGEVLTRILGVFGANVLVASVQNVLVHERGARGHLPEERNLDRFANLDSLTLLHEDLAGVLAPVFAVERRNTVLLRVVAFLERLQGRHEVVSAGDTGGNDTLCDTGGDGTFDDRGDRVHWSDDLVLELWWDVKFDLLEEVL